MEKEANLIKIKINKKLIKKQKQIKKEMG